MTEPAPDAPARRIRWWHVLGVVLAVVVLAAGGFLLWATNTPEPGPAAVSALESDEMVTVTEGDGYTFEPSDGARVGLVLYPGGRVDPASYAGIAREIAKSGYLVVVPELTLNLAVLDPNAADRVIAAHPSIEQWAIGGHSLGGTMAAQYVADHPSAVDGLALWAAYPSAGTDLSNLNMGAVSIFGTVDGLVTTSEIADSRTRLPAETEYVAIEGGNHAQFGDYGPQSGDNQPSITSEEQQAQTVAATVRMLRTLQPS